MKNKEVDKLYPLTIITDRYSGVYSGAKYLAINRNYDEIPLEIDGNDVTCMEWWDEFYQNPNMENTYLNRKLLIGKGKTIIKAVNNLIKQLNENK